MENPFTLTFGQKPTEFISRTNQIGKIIHTFDMENPSNKVYMVAGVRGSGKTVSLAEIADHYSSNDQWIVLRLSTDTDLIAGAVSELTRVSQFHDLDLGLNLNLGIAELSVNKTNDSLEKEAMLRNILEKLKNKGKKVLFIIDEIINNSYVKVFASNFQIYITQNYPVYLVMAGLFDNISNLQNEKSLTFLYRAPKIFLEPLSIPAITTSYRSVFDISPSEAVEMAKLTKGYPFAFQILGYLKWETNDDLEKLLPKFDEELIIYAYEKIWSELSELDRKIVYVISTGVYKTGEIREKLSISPQLLNTYRKRLMERGVVNGSVRGELTLALPRFEEYIEMYCEVNLQFCNVFLYSVYCINTCGIPSSRNDSDFCTNPTFSYNSFAYTYASILIDFALNFFFGCFDRFFDNLCSESTASFLCNDSADGCFFEGCSGWQNTGVCLDAFFVF